MGLIQTQLVRKKNLDYHLYILPASPELSLVFHALLGWGAGTGLEARRPILSYQSLLKD